MELFDMDLEEYNFNYQKKSIKQRIVYYSIFAGIASLIIGVYIFLAIYNYNTKSNLTYLLYGIVLATNLLSDVLQIINIFYAIRDLKNLKEKYRVTNGREIRKTN